MKKWVLGVILIAILIAVIVLIIPKLLKYNSPKSTTTNICHGNYANIQSISCTKTNGGYLIQAKLNYSVYTLNRISKVGFVLTNRTISQNSPEPEVYSSTFIKLVFLNYSSSDYSFMINESTALSFNNVGVALRLNHSNTDFQCDISDTKNVTCS